jgi:crossover junction endodeoxyribonuclease RuvC
MPTLIWRTRNWRKWCRSPVRVLGVDCGSRVTGYGVVDSIDSVDRTDGSAGIRTNGRTGGNNNGCVFVHCGVIRVPTSDTFALRLKFIHDGLTEVIRQYQPDEAAFESLFHATNVQSALKLGHARGVSMVAAAEAGLPVYEYSPTEVKSAVTGYGRAEKLQVQQMILLNVDSLPEQYDASDALAVAICHVNTSRFKKLTAVSS